MKLNTLLTHYQLSQPVQPLAQVAQLDSGNKKAAVLIALVKRPSGLTIILTKRAQHLRHHPGQISFPGGKYEFQDNNLKTTALRETFEEIGITASEISIVGELASLNTSSGFIVTPFLGLVTNDHRLNIDVNEVESVFELPLHFLLDGNNFYIQPLIANKKRHFSYCLPYQQHFIWGATAQILKNLQQQLNNF